MSSLKYLVAAGFAMQAAAGPTAAPKTYRVDVGKNNFTFTPDTIKANVGDLLEFHFFPRNHSVVQGNFNSGCAPLDGGFFSGFVPTAFENATVFSVKVKTTDPIVFYCSQNTGNHCKTGMSAIVNPSSADQLQKYRDLAKNAERAISPPKIAGGEFSKVEVANPSSGSGLQSPSNTGVAAPSPTGGYGGNTGTGNTGNGAGTDINTGAGGNNNAGAGNGAGNGNNAGAGTGFPGLPGNGTIVTGAAGSIKAGLGGLAGAAVVALAWL